MLKRGKTQRAKSRTKKHKMTKDIIVRGKPELRKALRSATKESGRSVNDEATFRVECSFIDREIQHAMLLRAAQKEISLRRIVRQEIALATSHLEPTYATIKRAVCEILHTAFPQPADADKSS